MKYVICSQDRHSSKTVEFYTPTGWTWDIEAASTFFSQENALEYMCHNWPLFPANDSSSIFYVEAVL